MTRYITTYFYNATELSLFFRLSNDLQNNPAKAIYNAWINGAVIDSKGAVWIRRSKLHTILRTTKAIALFKIRDIGSRYREQYGKETMIHGTQIGALIDTLITEARTHRGSKYALYSEKLYMSIRDSEYALTKRLEYGEYLMTARRNLKSKRKRKFDIKSDELTGTRLLTSGEFSHIRSASLYPDLSDKVWNGLLVNKKTHDKITKGNVCNEKDLIRMCKKHGWKVQWYEPYGRHIARYD